MTRKSFKRDKLRCLNEDCYKASVGESYNKSTKYKFCPYCGTNLGFVIITFLTNKKDVEELYWNKDKELFLWKIITYQNRDQFTFSKKLILRK